MRWYKLELYGIFVGLFDFWALDMKTFFFLLP